MFDFPPVSNTEIALLGMGVAVIAVGFYFLGEWASSREHNRTVAARRRRENRG